LHVEWRIGRRFAWYAIAMVSLCGTRLVAQEAPPAVPAPQQPVQAIQEVAQQPVENATSNQVLHILVGHSVVIRTEARLKRVLVGNPAVLTTITTTPNELVVTAAAAGSSSLVLWHENEQSRIIEVFADVDISMLRETLERSFPGEKIQIEAEEGKIVLTGTASTPAVIEQLGKMAAPFSKDIVNSIRVGESARQKQVLLKVRFAEVDRSKLDAVGINLFSLGGANTIGTVSTQQFSSPSLGNQGRVEGTIGAQNAGTNSQLNISDLLNIFVFRPDLNLGATIRALQQNNVLQILAEPNLLAMSGEPATFLAGGELPYPIVQSAGGLNTVTIQFRPFGVKLEFTGTIQDDNTIRLKVAPEVSSLDFSNAVTITGFVLPALSTRRAQTVVELKDGQSFGIAGLLDRRTTVQLSKVPGIGDLPIIGLLFKSRSVNKTNTELVVIVTPTIVDPVGGPVPNAETPKMPVAPLDPAQFDKKVPHGGDKQ
jgi:pilus assembly protein CpaC